MAYQRIGWRFWVPTISAGIGCFLGISIFICFLTAFDNVHVAVWGGISGILAGMTLVLHCSVRHDKGLHLTPDSFAILMAVGVFGLISGFSAIIGYLVKGIMKKETGVNVQGSFIVVVWSFMTLKWGVFLYYYAKVYRRELLKETPGLIGSLQA